MNDSIFIRCYILQRWLIVEMVEATRLFDHLLDVDQTTGTCHIKILQRKFYATLFLQAFLLDSKKFQPIKMFEK